MLIVANDSYQMIVMEQQKKDILDLSTLRAGVSRKSYLDDILIFPFDLNIIK